MLIEPRDDRLIGTEARVSVAIPTGGVGEIAFTSADRARREPAGTVDGEPGADRRPNTGSRERAGARSSSGVERIVRRQAMNPGELIRHAWASAAVAIGLGMAWVTPALGDLGDGDGLDADELLLPVVSIGAVVVAAWALVRRRGGLPTTPA